jgi:hypothetical protein
MAAQIATKTAASLGSRLVMCCNRSADHWVVPAGASVVAGSVVSVSVAAGGVVVLGVVVVVVSPLHPATNIAIQTNINANKLLIARSPENEMVSKTLAPSREARI